MTQARDLHDGGSPGTAIAGIGLEGSMQAFLPGKGVSSGHRVQDFESKTLSGLVRGICAKRLFDGGQREFRTALFQ
jgi:hypothetical protein